MQNYNDRDISGGRFYVSLESLEEQTEHFYHRQAAEVFLPVFGFNSAYLTYINTQIANVCNDVLVR